MVLLRLPSSLSFRFAERQLLALLFQLPPCMTPALVTVNEQQIVRVADIARRSARFFNERVRPRTIRPALDQALELLLEDRVVNGRRVLPHVHLQHLMSRAGQPTALLAGKRG